MTYIDFGTQEKEPSDYTKGFMDGIGIMAMYSPDMIKGTVRGIIQDIHSNLPGQAESGNR